MHTTGSFTIKRALLVDGVFCVVVGLIIALASGWLRDELPVAGSWVIAVIGIVTALWGGLLVGASRRYPTRAALSVVAIANILVVVAILVWLIWEGTDMSGVGIAVVGVLGISVLRFAVYQSMLLRQ